MLQIKLILTNLIKWIKSEKRLFLILLINLSVVSAVIIYLFSFNNQLLMAKSQKIFKDTYGRTYGIRGEMNENIYVALNNLNNNHEMPNINFFYLAGMAQIDDKQGKVAAVKFLKEELIGYYYDKKYDVKESGKVALATDTYINLDYGTSYNKDTKYININNKKYDVSYTRVQFGDGMETMVGGSLVRMSYKDFVDEIKSINELRIIFEERLTGEQVKILKYQFKSLDFVVDLDIQPKETSGQRNYKNEMIIDTVLLLATLLCLLKIYEYILSTRKNEFVIYRIYGAKISFIRKILIIEVFVMTLSGFLIGTIIFLIVWHFVHTTQQIYFDLNTWISALVILSGCMFVVTLKMMIMLSGASLIYIKKEVALK